MNNMNKKVLATTLIAGSIGFLAGNAFWYLASPLWIDRVVQEEISAELQTRILAQGSFRAADAAHNGKGKATIFESATGKQVLRFTEFRVTNGPDLKVWLVKTDQISGASDVTASKWISLGPLKGNIGDQNYVLSGNVKAADYGSVVIWCKQFGVLFAAAQLSTAP